MSEGKYLGLLETACLASKPGLREKILSAAAENIKEGIPEEKIKW